MQEGGGAEESVYFTRLLRRVAADIPTHKGAIDGGRGRISREGCFKHPEGEGGPWQQEITRP